MTDTEEDIKLIRSNIEKKSRQSGVSVPADDIIQRVFAEHLNTYYDEVILCLRDASSIFLFGPGEAKGELEKRIQKDKLRDHVVGVETVDKMTNPQIVAKVKEHFLHPRAAGNGSAGAKTSTN